MHTHSAAATVTVTEEKKTVSKFAPTPDQVPAAGSETPKPVPIPMSDPLTLPSQPFSVAPSPMSTRKPRTNAKVEQALRGLLKRMKEAEENVVDLKASRDTNAVGVREAREKLAELVQAVERKASVLDLKKVTGYVESFKDNSSDVTGEIEKLQKAVKALEENEDVRSVKLKQSSVDSKIVIILKNLKELQTKVNENAGLQIIPTQASPEPEEEKREDQTRFILEEVNKKINEVKLTMQANRKEFTVLSEFVNAQLAGKASMENLIDLESAHYT